MSSHWHYEQQHQVPASALGRDFDYIVVGAGAAGCALARGLSADPSVTVLLLDLGGAGHADQRVRDGRRWKETLGSPIDQEIRTVLQPGLHDGRTGTPGRVIVANQGRTLGGSTALNATFWVRGNPSDYDHWSAACGCDGWSHADLLPTLRGIETWCGSAAGANSARRGSDGPVSVTNDLCRGDAAYDALLETAASRCGYKLTDDYNGTGGRGDEGCDRDDTIGYMQFNVDAASGERHDAFSSFVQPVLEHRPNLTVATSLRAVRAVFDTDYGQDPTCVGVEVELVGSAAGTPTRRVLARREVILCAGALRTPQLLMLSGIGDGAVLARHGIQPVAEAAEVGQGLQDHPFVQATHIAPLGPPGAGDNSRAAGLNGYVWSPAARERAPSAQKGPDIQLIICECAQHAPLSLQIGETLHQLTGSANAARRADRARGTARVSATAVLNHPASRGSVTLASADPADDPIVDPCYLVDEHDVAALAYGLRAARNLLRAQFGEGDSGGEAADDDKDHTEVRQKATTLWHFCGTARMGGDAASVCDPRLRVRRVARLRVADASVMPLAPGGNTMVTTMAIGARCATFLLEDHAASALAEVSPTGLGRRGGGVEVDGTSNGTRRAQTVAPCAGILVHGACLISSVVAVGVAVRTYNR